jgi:nucleotide-binding universal stress UspA family protein
MIDKILLPTDGSDHAERTIRHAVEIAKLAGASIVAMHAYNPEMFLRSKRGAIIMEELKATLEEEAKAMVAEVAARVQAEGLKATALTVEGPPAEAILHAIAEEKPDLVVMGSHGSGNLLGRALALGGVAEKVVRYSPVTVTVVK